MIEAGFLVTKESVKENLAQVKDVGIKKVSLKTKNIVVGNELKRKKRRDDLVGRVEELKKKMSTIAMDATALT